MDPNTVLLILQLVIPDPEKPDIGIKIPEKSVEACMTDAKEFLDAAGGLTKQLAEDIGAVAARASCTTSFRAPEPVSLELKDGSINEKEESR